MHRVVDSFLKLRPGVLPNNPELTPGTPAFRRYPTHFPGGPATQRVVPEADRRGKGMTRADG